VKWPNDLVADGKKLGGILIQLRADATAGAQAVIGIGINVRMPAAHAARIDQAWCDLDQLGADVVSRNELAAALLDSLLRRSSSSSGMAWCHSCRAGSGSTRSPESPFASSKERTSLREPRSESAIPAPCAYARANGNGCSTAAK